MGKVMQTASFSLAEVTYATGDISYLVQEQAKIASFRVKAKQENVSGVVLPAFEAERAAGTGMLHSKTSAGCFPHVIQTSTLLVWAVGGNRSFGQRKSMQRR